MVRKNKKLIVILGPTASGKSKLAVKVALWLSKKKIKRKFKIEGAEIISADSRQIYKAMDIGTDKIKKEEMKGIPHHLLNIASPKRKFSVAQYRKLALKTIEKIFKKGKIPILCGGTLFYIKALLEGITLPSVKPNWRLRRELEKRDVKELYQILKKLDLERAKTIEKKNKRRIIRAIEIAKTLGKVPKKKKTPPPFLGLMIGIEIEKEKLKEKIKKRFFRWLKEGLIEEVKKLRKMGLSFKKIEDFGIHYREIARFLKKEISEKEMIEKSIRSIFNYGKKQLRWLKREKEIKWIKKEGEAKKLIEKFLENNNLS